MNNTGRLRTRALSMECLADVLIISKLFYVVVVLCKVMPDFSYIPSKIEIADIVAQLAFAIVINMQIQNWTEPCIEHDYCNKEDFNSSMVIIILGLMFEIFAYSIGNQQLNMFSILWYATILIASIETRHLADKYSVDKQ